MSEARTQACFLLVLTASVTIFFCPTVYAQAVCQVTITHDYPKQTSPSQRISIASHVSGTCTSPFMTINSYSVRVDVTNPNRALISSNSTFSGYGSETFSVTVINSVTTPSSPTEWSLDFLVYVFAGDATEPSYTKAETVGIQVGPSVTSSEVLTLTAVLTTMVHPIIATTETLTESLLPQTTLQSILVLLLLAVVAVSIVLSRSRKRMDQTRVY